MAIPCIYVLCTRYLLAAGNISPADLRNGWQGRGIFAISSACRR